MALARAVLAVAATSFATRRRSALVCHWPTSSSAHLHLPLHLPVHLLLHLIVHLLLFLHLLLLLHLIVHLIVHLLLHLLPLQTLSACSSGC